MPTNIRRRTEGCNILREEAAAAGMKKGQKRTFTERFEGFFLQSNRTLLNFADWKKARAQAHFAAKALLRTHTSAKTSF